MANIIKNQLVYRSVFVAILYLVISILVWCLSYYIRFDGRIPSEHLLRLYGCVFWLGLIQVFFLLLFRQCNVAIFYFSMVDLRLILFSNIISCLILFSVMAWMAFRIPLGVVVIDLILLTCCIASVRLALRIWSEWNQKIDAKFANSSIPYRSIAVFGAGDAGARVVSELLAKPGLKWKPVAFFDDDPRKWGQRIHGVPIVGKPELIRESPWRDCVRKIIVTAPSAKPVRIGEIARLASELGISSDTLPTIDKLVDGVVKFAHLRPLSIEDLLHREPVLLDRTAIEAGLQGKVIVVTGAGGSIGSELCRQILNSKPQLLILIERSETLLFQIEQQLLGLGGDQKVVSLVADVGDDRQIKQIFRRYRPYAIYHAAAHKHVPLMESQPGEAIRNNSIGTAKLINNAHEFGVSRFVMISTDKAINPTNIMGASKRLAEIFLQAFQAAHPNSTRLIAVRFGNVLGSSGSVVPTFQRQIAAGGPVTVTHPDVTRFFMTIKEAVGLVLQAGVVGSGGEIFVLDMGNPVKIVDLAKQLIELSGYKAMDDIEIKYVGLRPGEKMFEEISHKSELLIETGHPKILRFISKSNSLSEVKEFFDKIEPRLNDIEPGELKKVIQEMVPEYDPYSE